MDNRLGESQSEATRAVDVTPYFVPIGVPLAGRAALWSGDCPAATALVDGFTRPSAWARRSRSTT